MAANEQVLPMVGKLKNLRLATEVQLSAAADDEDKTKSQIADVKPEAKLTGDMLMIVPTSRPAIGNTLVVRCLFL